MPNTSELQHNRLSQDKRISTLESSDRQTKCFEATMFVHSTFNMPPYLLLECLEEDWSTPSVPLYWLYHCTDCTTVLIIRRSGSFCWITILKVDRLPYTPFWTTLVRDVKYVVIQDLETARASRDWFSWPTEFREWLIFLNDWFSWTTDFRERLIFVNDWFSWTTHF